MINITKQVIKDIIQHAKEGVPFEVCGYLAGKNNIVTDCYRLTNKDHSIEHYSFIPEEQFKVLRDVRNKKLELMIAYHSHPNSPARMSEEDINLAYDKNIIYAIISLKEKQPIIKLFDMKSGEPKEIEFEVIENDTFLEPVSVLAVDLRNEKCPLNFVKTKLALDKIENGEILKIILDDGEGITNVPKSVKEEGHIIVKIINKEDYWNVFIRKQ